MYNQCTCTCNNSQQNVHISSHYMYISVTTCTNSTCTFHCTTVHTLFLHPLYVEISLSISIFFLEAHLTINSPSKIHQLPPSLSPLLLVRFTPPLQESYHKHTQDYPHIILLIVQACLIVLNHCPFIIIIFFLCGAQQSTPNHHIPASAGPIQFLFQGGS